MALHDKLEFVILSCGDEILDKSLSGKIWAAGFLLHWMEACWVASCELPVALHD